jgi:hypothetical protein
MPFSKGRPMAPRVIESLSGVGEIYAGDVLLRSTPYRLSVFRDDDSPADAIPSRIEGHIDITGMAEATVLAGPQALTLRLEDGRRLEFTLTSSGGTIVGESGLRPA